MDIDDKRNKLEEELKSKAQELLDLIGIADSFLLKLDDVNIICAGSPVGVEQLAKIK